MVAADPAKHGVSMLFVEDEPDSREMLCEIIRHRFPDVRLLIADNGEAGLESFKRYQPDIVITDINIPIINGLRMAAEIKSLCPSTEIIALTAYSNSQYLIQAIEIGISNYILKPIDIRQFFTALEKVLSIVRSKRVIAWQDYVIRDLNTELARKGTELEAMNKELE
ncbi:MAG: response regulator, partial [Desulfuromonadaceae bacterium]